MPEVESGIILRPYPTSHIFPWLFILRTALLFQDCPYGFCQKSKEDVNGKRK